MSEFYGQYRPSTSVLEAITQEQQRLVELTRETLLSTVARLGEDFPKITVGRYDPERKQVVTSEIFGVELEETAVHNRDKLSGTIVMTPGGIYTCRLMDETEFGGGRRIPALTSMIQDDRLWFSHGLIAARKLEELLD